jgi:fumarate hydratase class II
VVTLVLRLSVREVGWIVVLGKNLMLQLNPMNAENFQIGGPKEQMPIELVHALGVIKKASAIVNHELGKLSKDKTDLVVKV